jgi:hypothetical protein
MMNIKSDLIMEQIERVKSELELFKMKDFEVTRISLVQLAKALNRFDAVLGLFNLSSQLDIFEEFLRPVREIQKTYPKFVYHLHTGYLVL